MTQFWIAEDAAEIHAHCYGRWADRSCFNWRRDDSDADRYVAVREEEYEDPEFVLDLQPLSSLTGLTRLEFDGQTAGCRVVGHTHLSSLHGLRCCVLPLAGMHLHGLAAKCHAWWFAHERSSHGPALTH